MKYRVVINSTLDRFSEEIERLLSEGWELQGGVTITYFEGSGYKTVYFAQALIKRQEGTMLA